MTSRCCTTLGVLNSIETNDATEAIRLRAYLVDLRHYSQAEHGVNNAEATKGPAVIWRLSGNESAKDEARFRLEMQDRCHGQPNPNPIQLFELYMNNPNPTQTDTASHIF